MSKYYSINEDAACRAKEMNSFHDYTPGSATAEYRQMVDAAAQIAEAQKRKVGAWQRQLNDNAIRAADYIKAIYPASGERPSALQRKGANHD